MRSYHRQYDMSSTRQEAQNRYPLDPAPFKCTRYVALFHDPLKYGLYPSDSIRHPVGDRRSYYIFCCLTVRAKTELLVGQITN